MFVGSSHLICSTDWGQKKREDGESVEGGGGERAADKRLTLSESRAFIVQGKEVQMYACSVMHHCFIQSWK